MLLIILSLELFYHYKIYQLKPQQITSQREHSLIAKEIAWVSLMEEGDITLEKTTTTEFMFEVFSLATASVKSKRINRVSIKGFHLASMVSLQVAPKQESSRPSRDSISETVRTIWLTRNTTVEDLMGYFLENVFLGREMYGLSDAAMHYFGKDEVDLSEAELISIISLFRAPSRYDPIRNPRRFKLRVEYITEKLKENWPEKYGDFQFVIPVFQEQANKALK
jgi:hypothetical protein